MEGKTFCLEAEAMNDWFDLNVAKALNKIIIENAMISVCSIQMTAIRSVSLFIVIKIGQAHFRKKQGLFFRN